MATSTTVDARMISLSEIQSALARIRKSIPVSPCNRSETFSDLTGNSIYLKLENRQRTGAYKERGALNKLLSLSEEERSQGVIAASAGNHAQAVAYHATKLGISARIVMPLATPLIKVSATRGYGGDVVLHGANYDEAFDEALRVSAQDRLTFVHAFNDDPRWLIDVIRCGTLAVGRRMRTTFRKLLARAKMRDDRHTLC